VNKKGEQKFINCDEKTVTAVTWGVFPGREVLQPTVCDSGVVYYARSWFF
jgi:methylenetetrahydrofolate reductase (NADPH)